MGQLLGDADGSYNFGELPRFLEKLRGGADLVMGCRLPKGGRTVMRGAMPWKHRWIGNPVLTGLGRILFKSPVDDFHCGLRAFRKDAILVILPTNDGHLHFSVGMPVLPERPVICLTRCIKMYIVEEKLM